ncbi:MAG: hypothetical protein Q9167_004942 [Letrouitia subvulpina]
MVSFSCESCVSEAQKYQGKLYNEKVSKSNKKSVRISDAASLPPRKAYVEDVPDQEESHSNAIAIVDAPPHAPSPPPRPTSKHAQPVNVFDFLVAEDTPNASKVSLGGTKAQMEMKPHAPPLFEINGTHRASSTSEHEYDSAYETQGYSYGTQPIPAAAARKPLEFKTPAPNRSSYLNGSTESIYELPAAASSERKSTDKKRKRQHVEDLDLTITKQRPQLPAELDSVMADAPTPILHSGLTGGLNRLLSDPEHRNGGSGNPDAGERLSSPVKRPKHVVTTQRRGGDEKVRKTSSGALVRIRKGTSSRRTSDESQQRPRKQQRSSRHDPRVRREQRSLEGRHRSKQRKAIEYHPEPSQHEQQQQQLVPYTSSSTSRLAATMTTRAQLFLSFVTKGPESERGISMNKALKRYHRERGTGVGAVRGEEEKELWKGIRVRRNSRGEVVVVEE